MSQIDASCSATGCSKRAWHKGLCNYHAIMHFYHDHQVATATATDARNLMNSAELKRRPGTSKNGIRRLDTIHSNAGGRMRASPRG